MGALYRSYQKTDVFRFLQQKGSISSEFFVGQSDIAVGKSSQLWAHHNL